MTDLEPCPHCDRHVMITETACPFCEGDLADAFADRAPRSAPRVRLGRAATFAFGAVALAQGACGDSTPSHPPDASPPDAAMDGGSVPIYAAAPTPDDGSSRG
jgi:hypothetical protein